MSLELISGELFLRQQGVLSDGATPLQTQVDDEFWAFLDLDYANYTTNLKKDFLIARNIGKRSLTAYELKIEHDVKALALAIEKLKDKVLSAVSSCNCQVGYALERLQADFDTVMMNLVLEYYSILQNEISLTRSRLSDEQREKVVALKQLNVLRNTQLYAAHLKLETRNRCCYTILRQDSPQFQRCGKAVLDNLAQSFCGAAIDEWRQKVRVLHVFKLHNTMLAKNLQVLVCALE